MEDQLVGAAISLFSALMVFVLTSINQWMKDDRERNWVLADRKLQRRLDTLNLRLADVQRYLNEKYEIISTLYEIEYKILLLRSKIDTALMADIETALAKLSDHYRISNKSFPSIFNLGDSELSQMNISLSQLIIKEQDEYHKLGQKLLSNQSIDDAQEQARIGKFYTDASNILYSMIKRVDELSGLN